MTKFMRAVGIAIGLSAGALGFAATAAAEPVYLGLFSKVAVSGYDPVSYFEAGGVPKKGSDDFEMRYQGATYRFASAANQARFKADPVRFAPQYGGHCAWAAAQGYLAPGDPSQYRLVGGKLYLNYDAGVQRKWVKDIPGFIKAGDRNWPKLAAE